MDALAPLLPFALLLLLCPLMMLFMHGSHGGGHDQAHDPHADHTAGDRADPARQVQASNDEARP
ncbi:MAG TPA: DUF2933 domain-containing protein [Gaiellaceae bacterium]|nr:DUF2933 domain-containing protein [Gaiellaceae bacterium]